jgi:glycosyltransferase involved in cell wall biosynthesis
VNAHQKKNTPLVSVIMPLFNKRAYVRRAIDSIQKQTFRNWELIIIDDGSTDGSSQEIPKSDGRIRFYNQSNAGPSIARNNGIRNSRGKFITFIDADDYYYAFKIEHEMEVLSNKKSAEWMFSAGNFETKNGTELGKIYKINNDEVPRKSKLYSNAIKQLKISNWPIDGLCIRKRLIQQLNGFRGDMRCYEITEFLFRCALFQPKVFIHPEPLYSVVKIHGSTSKILVARTEGLRLMGKSLLDLSKQYSDYSNQLRRLSKTVLLNYIGSLILEGSKGKARQTLMTQFPFKKNAKWIKMCFASVLPDWILHKVSGQKILKEFV